MISVEHPELDVFLKQGYIVIIKKVPLKLTREGTSGRAEIDWSLKGSGVNAAMVTASDTGISSGTVTMEAGNINQSTEKQSCQMNEEVYFVCAL